MPSSGIISVVLASLCGVLLPIPASSHATAAERTIQAEYIVSLYGLPIGTAWFDSTFGARSFSINGRLASSGIARLFDKTTGTTTVSGVIDNRGATPRTFQSAYHSGKKNSRTTIRFDKKRVIEAVNEPARETLPADWVHVPAEELAATLDPISATLIRAGSASEVCGRTLRVFDGEMRADLKLTHRSTGTIARFEGEGVTCDARFVPVAGYRKSRKQIAYLANRSRITITFARLADTGFFTPVDASIGTQVGTIRVTARKIEVR